MTSVGRIAFAVVVVAFIFSVCFMWEVAPSTPLWPIGLFMGSLVGLLIYPIIFLKLGLTLSRVALLLFTAAFLIFLWSSIYLGD